MDATAQAAVIDRHPRLRQKAIACSRVVGPRRPSLKKKKKGRRGERFGVRAACAPALGDIFACRRVFWATEDGIFYPHESSRSPDKNARRRGRTQRDLVCAFFSGSNCPCRRRPRPIRSLPPAHSRHDADHCGGQVPPLRGARPDVSEARRGDARPG